MIDRGKWKNIWPHVSTAENGRLEEEQKYFEKFGEHIDFTYLPEDATLEKYKNDILKAIETGEEITADYYDYLPEGAFA